MGSLMIIIYDHNMLIAQETGVFKHVNIYVLVCSYIGSQQNKNYSCKKVLMYLTLLGFGDKYRNFYPSM